MPLDVVVPATSLPSFDTFTASGRKAVSADAREAVKCSECRLNQYRAQDNLCRRCHAVLPAMPLPEIPVVNHLGQLVSANAKETLPEKTVRAYDPIDPELFCAGLAQMIKETRLRRNLGRKDLAARAGWMPNYISKLEHGTSVPNLASLLRLANAFDIPLSVFIARVEARTKALKK